MKRCELLHEVKENLKTIACAIRKNKRSRKKGKHGDIPLWKIESTILSLKREFRHLHIAYCEVRGVPRERIETPGEFHQPNEMRIQRIKETWEGAIDDEEDVRDGEG